VIEVTKPITKPCLLVVHEKHGDRYFHIKDDVTLHRAALKLLSEREADGYYKPSVGPAALGYTEGDLSNMPESLRDPAARMLKAHKQACVTYMAEVKDYGAITRIIAERDGAAAWTVLRNRVLRNRVRPEYESLFFEQYEEIP
jgi:hypothetical protein